MDLFKTKIQEDKLHDSFKFIRNNALLSKEREVIQSWGQGLLTRKGESKKFINEFQTTFNSAFWELYLNKAFIEIGLNVDYSKNSPDFCISTTEGYLFNVEAVITDQPKLGERILRKENYKDFSTIKLAGKIKDKKDLFIGENQKKHPYSSLKHVTGRPFVIAIAPFDSDNSSMQNNEIINRVLFGIDAPNRESLFTGRQPAISAVTKENGANVKLGIFTNNSYKEISAVIFSTTGTFGKVQIESKIDKIIRSTRYRKFDNYSTYSNDKRNQITVNTMRPDYYNYKAEIRLKIQEILYGSDISVCHSRFHNESHLDGLHIYYNPYAEFPLDKNIFSPPEITHNFFDLAERIPIQDHPDGSLVSREIYDLNETIYNRLLHENSNEKLLNSFRKYFQK
ncbi:hypothetical protein [Delftia sp. GW456-R20]|uniref:hypothetical protein n=1 Tax=Delftia sp. GW456-R20 TaxID=1827145 RepID=UPI000B07332D|nr:hypothetical protein [Delftia sp. GW456-R20]